ncbi:MAG TPA: GntR family transcriptional regulator [Gaiellaceae bacterium]
MPSSPSSPSTPVQPWAAAALDGHRTLAEKAYAALHEAIVSGALAPGQRLRIEELAGALGMSHLPIREAIRQLESRGLVQFTPHRGGRVTEISLEDLCELYEARLLIEPEIIARAAENFSDENAQTARTALSRHAEASKQGQMTEIWASHTAFHFALYDPCRSSWLLRLVTPLWESSQRYRMTMPPLNSDMRRKEAQREHEEMLAACEAHDGARAAIILHNHLVRTANLITDQMGGEAVFALR